MQKVKVNYNALISELLLAIGFLSMIPYAQGNFMQSLGVPLTWIPYLTRIGIGAGVFIRLWPNLAAGINRIFPGLNLPTTVPATTPASAIQPQPGAPQPTIKQA